MLACTGSCAFGSGSRFSCSLLADSLHHSRGADLRKFKIPLTLSKRRSIGPFTSGYNHQMVFHADMDLRSLALPVTPVYNATGGTSAGPPRSRHQP